MMIMRRRRIIIVMIHTFSIALFPAERAPDEDDNKGAGSGDNRSTKKYHVRTFSSVLLVAQCSNNACLIFFF